MFKVTPGLELGTHKDGRQPSKDMPVRDGWYILVRNVGKDLRSVEDLFGLYRVRWQTSLSTIASAKVEDHFSCLEAINPS